MPEPHAEDLTGRRLERWLSVVLLVMALNLTYLLQRIQKALAPDTALIAWVDYKGHARSKNPAGDHWGVVVRSEGEPAWIALSAKNRQAGWSTADDNLADDLRSALTRYNPDIDWEALAADLRKQRLTPLEPHLKGVKNLIVLPSQHLSGIPLETLTDRYRISYAPSATLFAWLREKRQAPATGDILAVGNAIFSSDQANDDPKTKVAQRGPRFRPLPGTGTEIEAIAAVIEKRGGKVRTLLGKDASLTNLEKLAASQQLAPFRYIHLATHGKALSQHGLNSFLALTTEDPHVQDYAKLSAGQILRTWKLNADLVTLSACETALGQHLGGEGYLGFSQAMLLSGARTLVVSQWNVSDHATTLLMGRFYENLQTSERTKADALQDARLWLRDLSRAEAMRRLQGAPKAWIERVPAGERPFAHPSFWAAFILIGDPGEPAKK